MEKLTILATTDVHGSILAKNYADNLISPSGLARFSTAVNQAKQNGATLVLDNGDILQGSPLLTIANQQKGPHLLGKIMNQIGYDYVNLGNHDFNYGPTVLQRYLDTLTMPCLTANILHQGVPLGKSTLVSVQNHTLALIAVCTDYIPHWEKSENIAGMDFLDPIETVKTELKRLRPLADAVIVMYHGGLENDPITGVATERFTGENVGYRLAQLPGIDVLITGHQHRSLIATIGTTVVTQTTLNAKEFAEITLTFGEKLQIDPKIVKMEDFEIDPVIDSIAEETERETQRWLDQPLGRIDGPSMKVTDGFMARLHKHPLVSFINQVQREHTQADLSACALFNGVTGFNPEITMRDIVSTYIYPNTLVVKQIDGKTLKEFLEKCAAYFAIKAGEVIVDPSYDEPKPQHFNYDMVDGIEYTIKVSNQLGQRIVSLFYQGKEVRENQSFTLVMNNYRAVGGGDFSMVPDLPTVLEINRDMSELLAETLVKHKVYTVKHSENIHVIP